MHTQYAQKQTPQKILKNINIKKIFFILALKTLTHSGFVVPK
jgi:hypothetical protein